VSKIFEVFHFCDEERRRIEAHSRKVVEVDGKESFEEHFYGKCIGVIQTPQGQIKLELEFEIKATSIEEAFSAFDVKAKEELEKAKLQIQAKQLIREGKVLQFPKNMRGK
jgi:uncharacterized protein (DUF488 family)